MLLAKELVSCVAKYVFFANSSLPATFFVCTNISFDSPASYELRVRDTSRLFLARRSVFSLPYPFSKETPRGGGIGYYGEARTSVLRLWHFSLQV